MFGFFMTSPSFTDLFDKAAYLDPGSGSFILQLIIATILGSLLILRSYWTKVKDFLAGLFSRGKNEDAGDE